MPNIRAPLVALLLAALAPAAHAHEYEAGALVIHHPWSRAAPSPVSAAGYLAVENTGEAADRLLAIACDCADLVQIHETTMQDGVMRMGPVEAVEIPPGGTATLEPGGLHVMFIRLQQPFEAGDRIPATLTFERAGAVEVEFAVQPLRSGEPAHDHGG